MSCLLASDAPCPYTPKEKNTGLKIGYYKED